MRHAVTMKVTERAVQLRANKNCCKAAGTMPSGIKCCSAGGIAEVFSCFIQRWRVTRRDGVERQLLMLERLVLLRFALFY